MALEQLLDQGGHSEIAGRVWATKAPVWIADRAPEDSIPPSNPPAPEEVRTIFAAPLLKDRTYRGVLVLYRQRPGSGGPTLRQALAAVHKVESFLEEDHWVRQQREDAKMNAISLFATGIVRDYSELLMTILGNLDVILGNRFFPDELKSKAALIQDAALDAVALTRHISALTYHQAIPGQALQLNAIVRESEKSIRELAGEKVQVRFDLEPKLGWIHADHLQMLQVVYELAKNAVESMPSGGTLVIRTANIPQSMPQRLAPILQAPGDYIELTVQDDGCGMDIETKSRIFEPFFSTKSARGLGLSVVYGIVKRAGGWIRVESNPGQGCRFSLFLRETACPFNAAPESPA